jgi:ABC-type Fe3+-hydroxamate transport system substrate-binding protein
MQKTSLFWAFNLILGFSLVVFACQKKTEEQNSSTEKLAEEEADGIWDTSLSKTIETNPMRICISEPSMNELYFSRFFLMDGDDNINAFKESEPFQNCKVEVLTDISQLAGM